MTAAVPNQAEGPVIIAYVLNSMLFEGAVQNLLGVFDLSGHLDAFTNGILDVTGIVYYLSAAAIFLFLSVQLVKKRRWN